MTRLIDMGLEPVADVNGYAVFTGCEGEDPKLRAFLVDKELAEALAALMRASYDDSNVQCEFAILTDDMGLVAANDFQIKTHAQLAQRITNARAMKVQQ